MLTTDFLREDLVLPPSNSTSGFPIDACVSPITFLLLVLIIATSCFRQLIGQQVVFLSVFVFAKEKEKQYNSTSQSKGEFLCCLLRSLTLAVLARWSKFKQPIQRASSDSQARE